jgi:hypothetical protein
MAFVRAESRFTHHYMPAAASSAAPPPALASPSAPSSTTGRRRARKARRLSATTNKQQQLPFGSLAANTTTKRMSSAGAATVVAAAAAAAAVEGKPESKLSQGRQQQRRRLSASMGHSSALSFDMRGLGGFTGRGPKLFMVDWNTHAQQWRSKQGAQGNGAVAAINNNGVSSGDSSNGGISMKHIVMERGEIAREMRKAWVHLGSASHAQGYGAGWAHMEMGRCTSSPAYLLDLFEPRGWCLEKRWTRGFDFQPGASSSDTTTTKSGEGARALCLPEAHHNRGGSHGQHNGNHGSNHGSGGSGSSSSGMPLRACEVTPALGAPPITFSPASSSSSSASPSTEPGSAAYRASAVATTLGCSSSPSSASEPTHSDAKPASSTEGGGGGGGGSALPVYRILTAEASTESEWLALGQAACGGKASAYTTYPSEGGGGAELGSGLPLKHKALSMLYDQLVGV